MPAVGDTIGPRDGGSSIERGSDAIKIDVERRLAARVFRPEAHYARSGQIEAQSPTHLVLRPET